MTTLANLLDDVYTLTNRPDLVSLSQTAIRSATLKMHQSDFYSKDLLETAIVFDTADYTQSFDYKSLFPQWRSIKYLRKVDPVTLCPGKILDVVTPDEILDSYGVTKTDVYYGAGTNLQIKSSTQQANYIIGIYQHPTVTLDGYSSWIADEFPFAIIYDACATIFKAIGFDEQEQTFRALVEEQLALLRISNVTINGY